MACNGYTVIDMDAHIRERADKFFKDYIDPEYRAPFNRLCEAIARQEKKGDRYALFGSTHRVIEQIEAGRALGVRDTFGLTAPLRDGARPHGLPARPQGPAAADPAGGELGRQGAARGHGPRPGRRERPLPDACVELLRAARRGLRERALPRLSPLGRRFLRAGAEAAEMDARRQHARRRRRAWPRSSYWAERDPNLVGIYISPQAPGGKLLDNPDLHPLYDAAQALDLPLLAHGGTARPPYGPGTLRPRRRLVPAARLLRTRGPAWRRWAR